MTNITTENQEEQNYLDLLQRVLDTENIRNDRTNTGVKSIFGTQLRYSLANNTLPLCTTKQAFFRGIVEETLQFLRGDCDTTKLQNKQINIWRGNSSRQFLDNRGLTHLPEGNIGKGYPFQYRNFGGEESSINYLQSEKRTGIDQIANVINTLKTNPTDRRMLVAAWNPKQNDEAALPACHSYFQVYAHNNKLSLQAYCRSSDLILGYFWNTTYYALIAHLLAQTVGMKAEELIMTTGDSHIYSTHEQIAQEQITRKPYKFPTFKINKELNSIIDIENLQFEDFELQCYKHHKKLIGKMAI